MLATMMQAAAAVRIQATVRGHLARTAALRAAAEESQLLRTALQVRLHVVTHGLSNIVTVLSMAVPVHQVVLFCY